MFRRIQLFYKSFKSRTFYCLIIFILVSLAFLRTDLKEPKIVEVGSERQELTPTAIKTESDLSDVLDVKISKEIIPASKNAELDKTTSLTGEKLEYLRSIMQRSADSITVTKTPDGSSTAFLNGTFNSVSAAKRLPDGRLVTQCFERFDALEKFLELNSTSSK